MVVLREEYACEESAGESQKPPTPKPTARQDRAGNIFGLEPDRAALSRPPSRVVSSIFRTLV